MTANSPAPPKRLVRWTSMESLGFFDAPTSATVAYRPDGEVTATTLISTPTAPSGDMVKDLWESTELDAPSLADWTPSFGDRRRLRGRDFRWTRVLFSMALVLAVGLGAAWLALRPAEEAEASLATVSDRAADLDTALTGLDEVSEQVAAEQDATGNSASALFDVDEAARGLFDASAALPSSQIDARDTASDVASISLDASRRLRDALALRGAVESMVVPPILESDPGMTDLGGATLSFTEWRASFESASQSITQDLPGEVEASFESFVGSLDQIQARYVDAIRLTDPEGALAAVTDLEAGLAAIRYSMMSAVAESAENVESDLVRARNLIDQLLG